MHTSNTKSIYRHAENMRRNPTDAEKALFDALRKVKIDFYFQAVLFFWIADFYFKDAKLTIEVDGMSHDRKEQQLIDRRKANKLLQHGIETVRIKNQTVLANPDGAAQWIKRCVEIRIGQLKIYGRKPNYKYGIRKRLR